MIDIMSGAFVFSSPPLLYKLDSLLLDLTKRLHKQGSYLVDACLYLQWLDADFSRTRIGSGFKGFYRYISSTYS